MKAMKLGVTMMVALSVASAMAMPRNSFLIRPAKSKAELIKQISSEPVVMDRYMRHYSMSREEVLAYVGSLKLGRAKKTGVYSIYGVPKDGVIHATPQLVKQNSLVWEDSMGEPILLEVCGNPFGQGPKRATMSDMIAATPAPANDELVAMSTIPSQPIVSSNVSMDMAPMVPTVTQTPEPPTEVASRRRDNLGWLAIIPAAAAITVRNGGNDQPVPEPGTMTALGLGTAALVARRRNKKSN